MRIGELARRSGATASAVRFYEREGLLPAPARAPNGYRDYDDAAVERVRFVRRAQAAGLALRDVVDVLAIRDGGVAPCGHVRELLVRRLADVESQLVELGATRDSLAALLRRAQGLDGAAEAEASFCAILEGDLTRQLSAGRAREGPPGG